MPAEPPINKYKSYVSQTQLLQKAFEKVVETNERTVAAMKKGIAGDYARMLKQLKEVVGNAHENYANPQSGKLNFQELQRYNRIRVLEKNVDEAIADNYKPIRKRVISDQKRIIENTYDSSVSSVINAIGGGIKAPYLTGAQINEILMRPWSGVTMAERLLLRQSYLGVQIKGQIRRGVMGEGQTYQESIKSITETVTKDYMGTGRTAEDAAHQYQSDTTNEALKGLAEKDIQLTKTWVSAGDERVRDAHILLDGQTVDVQDMFEVPSGEFVGYKADGPGLFGDPAMDANCRCWFVAGIRPREEE